MGATNIISSAKAKNINARAIAAQIMMRVLQQSCSLTTALADLPASVKKSPALGLIKALCYGVCRWYLQLQEVLQPLLKKPLKSKDQDIQLLLIIGLYQLGYLRIPAHAVLAETVAATRILGKDWASGLVNAVLRAFQRQEQSLSELVSTPSAQYSHPEWLIQQLQAAWPEDWQAICQANNTHPPLSLRVNQRIITRDDYLSLLAQQQIIAEPIANTRQGIVIHSPMDVTQLPQFSEGSLSVQDGAAQLAAELLQLAPGQKVLDACAAPGGKTAHILEQQPALHKLLAIDIDAKRLERIADNLQRLKLTATLQFGDATQPQSWWDGQLFDRILLDAPCTATGVIRRHPDIKLLRRATDIAATVTLQARLLRSLWPLLKPGGLFVYATCSVLPVENSLQIINFLDHTADAVAVPIIANWGITQTVGRQILPGGENNLDGFYYACLQKKS